MRGIEQLYAPRLFPREGADMADQFPGAAKLVVEDGERPQDRRLLVRRQPLPRRTGGAQPEGGEVERLARLMRLAGVRGVRKSKRVFTTRSDKTTVLPSDLVNRRFIAPAPRRLWVCDVTYVATWSGFAYVAFVTDVYSRRIVGWNVASTLRSEILPMQALDMAAWGAGGRLDGLIHHADHGSNYTAMVYTDRIVELGAVPSTGTVGDSFDNAMAEAVNNLYKTELIRQRGPWRTVEQVELATLEWVWWWNNSRLLASSTCAPPSRSRTRTTLTKNQANRRQPDRAPDRNESQADSR